MSQEVFGLRCEFIFQHGHYMALYKDEGLDACELSTLQVSMLEANQVPNLLPLQIQEADHRIRLLYNVSAKRMLSHVLKVDRLSTQHVATFMYAIVSTLVESRNYMLNEMGFVLKENFIFLGSDWSDVYLTYVPLEGVKEEEYVIFKTLASLMKQLLLKLNDEERLVAELWMESLAKIQSLQGYKESLLAFMDEQPRLQEVVQSVKHTYEEAGEDLSSVQLQQPPIVENSLPKPLRHLVEEQSVFKPNGGGDQETNDGQGNPISFSFLPISNRSNFIVLAIIILISAFLWQNYATFPSVGAMQITAGISVLLGNVWFVIKYLGVPRFTKTTTRISLPFLPVIDKQLEHKLETPLPQPINIQNYYQNLHMHTTLLNNKKPNATVFLGRVMNQPKVPRIEAKVEGVPKIVPLTNNPFTMGRGDASLKVDYLIEEAGVSRIHTEIMQKDDGYEIKDSGSTNGTYLNGEPLVAYQSYPLKDGDEIRIVRSAMIFRV